MVFSEIRVRSRIPQEQLDNVIGKVVTERDSDIRLQGPCRVYGPKGQPLAVYAPGALADTPQDVLEVLHGIRDRTDQRPLASGSRGMIANAISYSNRVLSSTVGYMEGKGDRSFGNTSPASSQCRLTRWTGEHVEMFASLFPLLESIDARFRELLPARWASQKRYWEATRPEVRIPGTSFTTITVNNSYATGVHKDAGDLDSGFGCLACFRKGEYTGGHLTLPEYRVSVDMRHGDLLLMDNHQYHGNSKLHMQPGAERVSLVCYYRTKMARCTEDMVHENARKPVI